MHIPQCGEVAHGRGSSSLRCRVLPCAELQLRLAPGGYIPGVPQYSAVSLPDMTAKNHYWRATFHGSSGICQASEMLSIGPDRCRLAHTYGSHGISINAKIKLHEQLIEQFTATGALALARRVFGAARRISWPREREGSKDESSSSTNHWSRLTGDSRRRSRSETIM